MLKFVTALAAFLLLGAGSVRAGETGTASWYGAPHIGHRTANGEIFTGRGRTAAHRDLPMGAVVRVINLRNKRSVVVRINDRGPYVGGRVIDLCEAAARHLGMHREGTAPVRLEVLARR